MDYREQTIDLPINRHDDTMISIPVWVAGDTGLAYHHAGGKEELGFVITHLGSKQIVVQTIDTEYEVKQILEKIALLTNWHQSEKDLLNRSDLAKQIRDLGKDIIQRLNMQLESAMGTSDIPNHLAETITNNLDDEVLRSALLYAFKIIPEKIQYEQKLIILPTGENVTLYSAQGIGLGYYQDHLGNFNVIHEKSKFVLQSYIDTVYIAQLFIKELAPLMDWNQENAIPENQEKGRALLNQIENVQEKVQEQIDMELKVSLGKYVSADVIKDLEEEADTDFLFQSVLVAACKSYCNDSYDLEHVGD